MSVEGLDMIYAGGEPRRPGTARDVPDRPPHPAQAKGDRAEPFHAAPERQDHGIQTTGEKEDGGPGGGRLRVGGSCPSWSPGAASRPLDA